ncbi:4a-hydroxytetrahydrobiopterin dehydratase [Variovorax sp. dw_308]|uniref:4a-hydroxytetrahydrobiopterin dehydratase n=1 Tax=Variovorax sp. dw_308 TaxID=2721546 RepID=UPI001C45E802
MRRWVSWDDALQGLPGWDSRVSDLAGGAGRQRTEICKSYEFASFEDAVAFMGAAVPKIAELQHHPRWPNIWRTVSVWLSTWDVGHKPSALDLEVAAHLDLLRATYPASRLKRS